ncbi:MULTISPECIES: MoaD/ThiS family protein [Paraliobacillus]|uniref:MoaD/ThiS family protein n=1 Tax=Paraliobacillus TaxID=200903 RepID=UPI000DD491E3|nr:MULTISPECIES: MoaD/ThiS family protein [Paraliobacillus]
MKVLLFSHLQESLGTAEVELDWKPQSVEAFKLKFKEVYNVTGLDQVMIAINESYAMDTDIIEPGDVVALIPPVSGG